MPCSHILKMGLAMQLAIAGLAGCQRQTLEESNRGSTGIEPPVTGTVDLTIDFDGQRENLNLKLPCPPDSTVFAIMQQARSRNELEFESSGSGQFVFVSSIHGIENQQQSGRNWIFRVNGELANRSCGAVVVQSGDRIEWTYGTYQP